MKKVMKIFSYVLISANIVLLFSISTPLNTMAEAGGGGSTTCPNIGNVQCNKSAVNNGDLCKCALDKKLYAINTCVSHDNSCCNTQNCSALAAPAPIN